MISTFWIRNISTRQVISYGMHYGMNEVHTSASSSIASNHVPHTILSSKMSSSRSAQPLKVTASGSSSKGDQGGSRTPVASRGSSPRPQKPLADPVDISSPHELTAFVRSLCPHLSPPLPLPPSSVHSMTEEHSRWKPY